MPELGCNPLKAVQFITELSLYRAIFSAIPPGTAATFSTSPGQFDTSLAAASILNALIHSGGSPSLPSVHPRLLALAKADSSCRARLYLATTLTPYKNISYLDKKKKPQPVLDLIIRESLKLGTQNHYLDGIPSLFAATQLLKSPSFVNNQGQQHSERVAIGWYLEYVWCFG